LFDIKESSLNKTFLLGKKVRYIGKAFGARELSSWEGRQEGGRGLLGARREGDKRTSRKSSRTSRSSERGRAREDFLEELRARERTSGGKRTRRAPRKGGRELRRARREESSEGRGEGRGLPERGKRELLGDKLGEQGKAREKASSLAAREFRAARAAREGGKQKELPIKGAPRETREERKFTRESDSRKQSRKHSH